MPYKIGPNDPELKLQVGKTYENRNGHQWQVISVDGPRDYPVTAGRWYAGRYETRVFMRNGQYWPDMTNRWDLIKEVGVESE